VCDHCVWQWQ